MIVEVLPVLGDVEKFFVLLAKLAPNLRIVQDQEHHGGPNGGLRNPWELPMLLPLEKAWLRVNWTLFQSSRARFKASIRHWMPRELLDSVLLLAAEDCNNMVFSINTVINVFAMISGPLDGRGT